MLMLNTCSLFYYSVSQKKKKQQPESAFSRMTTEILTHLNRNSPMQYNGKKELWRKTHNSTWKTNRTQPKCISIEMCVYITVRCLILYLYLSHRFFSFSMMMEIKIENLILFFFFFSYFVFCVNESIEMWCNIHPVIRYHFIIIITYYYQ